MGAKCSKPDPEIYVYALREAGLKASQALHIGDSVEEDYWAATGVGMQAVILDRDQKLTQEQLKGVPTNRVIHDLKHLVGLLDSMKPL